MPKNLRSIVLLLLLLSFLLFLVGFRLGKKVERIDKNYVSPTPLKSIPTTNIQPTQSQLQFKSFLNTQCGIAFLYPLTFSEDPLSSQEAYLSAQTQQILVSCNKEGVTEAKKRFSEFDTKESQTVKNQKVTIYKKADGLDTWTVLNSQNGKTILFEVSTNLSNLVLKTLEFVN